MFTRNDELYNTIYQKHTVEGKTIKEIAKELNKPVATVNDYCRRNKIKKGYDMLENKIVEMYESGLTITQIAKELDKTYLTIKKKLIKKGVLPNGR